MVCKGKGKAVPLQASIGPEGSRELRFPDFMTTAQDGGKVVSLTHRPPLPPGNAPGTHFCYRLSRPQGHSGIGRILCQWKILMIPAGIEPAIFRFVAQHLKAMVCRLINFRFQARLKSFKKRLLDLSCPSVRPSTFRTQRLVSHCTDFSQKCVEKKINFG